METLTILKAINALPMDQRIFIVERVLHSIRKQEKKMSLKEAAALAYDDYKNDSELTELIRCFEDEDFYDYETR
ncbi:MAG: hypothetical protein LBQ50_04315 [Planctomycetaceae bacterium]|jgi:hypothetical protein|nr:hypothetical protein [Planctomycetaceae bacterium]